MREGEGGGEEHRLGDCVWVGGERGGDACIACIQALWGNAFGDALAEVDLNP